MYSMGFDTLVCRRNAKICEKGGREIHPMVTILLWDLDD